jgi:WD40 repeat protein
MLDENTLASGSNDKNVKIWDWKSFEQKKEISFKSDVTSLTTINKCDGTFILAVGLYKKIALLGQDFEVVKYFDNQLH